MGNDDLGGFCVSTPESPVERCDSDCRSSPSHVQGGPLPLPYDPSSQHTQAQSCHWRLSPHSSRCLLASATSPRAAARMRAVSPSEEGLFAAGSALASTSLRLAGPSSDISCLIAISPQSRVVPMIPLPLQQPDRVCPPPPLLHAVIAPRMCQPVQRLVGMVIPPTHRLRCCLLLARPQAQTRLGGEPPNARPQGSPLIWQPGASSRREGGLMLGRCCCGPLLTAASNPAAQHCSTRGPQDP